MGWTLESVESELYRWVCIVFCGPVVFQHLLFHLNQIQRRLKVRMLEDFEFDGILVVIVRTLHVFSVLLDFLFSCDKKWP